MIEYGLLVPQVCSDDLEQIKQLYLANGWIDSGEGNAEDVIKRIVASTFCFAVARDGDKIIGMGRGISDGVSDAYIQDVSVFPEYRKRGIGGALVRFLVHYMQSCGIGWIGLISVPGQQDFYKGLGFSEMQDYTPFLYSGEFLPGKENKD